MVKENGMKDFITSGERLDLSRNSKFKENLVWSGIAIVSLLSFLMLFSS